MSALESVNNMKKNILLQNIYDKVYLPNIKTGASETFSSETGVSEMGVSGIGLPVTFLFTPSYILLRFRKTKEA